MNISKFVFGVVFTLLLSNLFSQEIVNPIAPKELSPNSQAYFEEVETGKFKGELGKKLLSNQQEMQRVYAEALFTLINNPYEYDYMSNKQYKQFQSGEITQSQLVDYGIGEKFITENDYTINSIFSKPKYVLFDLFYAPFIFICEIEDIRVLEEFNGSDSILTYKAKIFGEHESLLQRRG